MTTHDDFAEFLKLLSESSVEYLIVGGYAVAYHGHVRYTKHLDILYRDSPENIAKLKNALHAFGFPSDSLGGVAFSEHGRVIRIGVKPVMIELINAISGLTFEQAWENRECGQYGSVPANFISRQDLLVNKQAAGRPQDLADLDSLRM